MRTLHAHHYSVFKSRYCFGVITSSLLEVLLRRVATSATDAHGQNHDDCGPRTRQQSFALLFKTTLYRVHERTSAILVIMVFSSSLFLVLCALAFGQLATCVLQQQPFNATDWNSSTVVPKENETSYPGIFMVSIIGAGAAGSSAAYWLSLANKRLGMNMGITVYENSSWIGGRE